MLTANLFDIAALSAICGSALCMGGLSPAVAFGSAATFWVSVVGWLWIATAKD